MKKMSTFASENGDVYEITDEFARKNRTSKILLEYDGTNITLDGDVKTHAELYEYCMTKPDFVVLVYNDLAYHVNKVTSEQIVFISSYVTNGYVKMERISISNENLVTITSGTAEMLANKTNTINDTNKSNTDKFPSLKAVADYVEFAVKATLCDGAGAAWTEAEQIAAQQRLGIIPVSEVTF